MDKRHQRRTELLQLLFAHTFDNEIEQYDDPSELNEEDLDWLAEIKASLTDLDAKIAEFAPERPLTDINKVDLAILRLITFESINKKTPSKVLADEAVMLAKEFGTETSHKFVNGVLGKILFKDEEKTDEDQTNEKE